MCLCCACYAGLYIVAHAQELSRDCRQAYLDLMLVCGLLRAKSHTWEQLPVLIRRTLEALVRVELFLPCSNLDMKLHSLLHAPLRILAAGSLTAVACWAPEQNWGQLQPMAANAAYPEHSIMHKARDRQVVNLYHARCPQAYSSSFRAAVIAPEPRHELYIPSVISRYCEAGGMQEVMHGSIRSQEGMTLDAKQLQGLHAGYVAVHAGYQQLWERYSRDTWRLRWVVRVCGQPAPACTAEDVLCMFRIGVRCCCLSCQSRCGAAVKAARACAVPLPRDQSRVRL